MTDKYERPADLPGRVCRTLQGLTLLEMSEDPFVKMVYRFTHIASGRCENPHEEWVAEFKKLEVEIEEAAYTSPAERASRAKASVDVTDSS